MNRYLAIDNDKEFQNRESTAWADIGISSLRVDAMDEGIVYANKENFMFVFINADNVNYLSKLKLLRNITSSPILIATSRFTLEEHALAINNGADAFGPIGDTEQNINSVTAVIQSIKSRKYSYKDVEETVLYHDILILPKEGKAYVGELEIPLTKSEIRLLCLLIHGAGRTFTHCEIFHNILDNDRGYDSHESVKAMVKRIRKKVGFKEVINTVWGKGYQIGSW